MILDFMKEENIEFKKIMQIRAGQCPNFYITGTSISSIERMGLKLATILEERELLEYKGIVKHFTICMPYYESQKEAMDFLLRLKDSISIAQDCYDSFCGVVLVELSDKWSEKGTNQSLNYFLDYIQDNQKICFVIVVPTISKSDCCEELYCEFSKCSIWMRINSATLSVDQCVSLFQNMASKKGYEVSDEAGQLLLDKLKLREETMDENIRIVQQLIRQIMFNRSIEGKQNKIINVEDVMYIAGSTEKNEKKNKHQIGFITNIR